MTYTPTTYEIALRAWVRACLALFDTSDPVHVCDVIYADQEGPRPTPPYASLRTFADRSLGSLEEVDEYDAEADSLSRETIEHREGTVSITLMGPQHASMADALSLSRQDDEVRAALDAAGIGLGAEVSRNAPGKYTGNVTDNRTVVDFIYRRCATRTTAGRQYIEHLGATYTPQTSEGTGVSFDLILPPED